MHALYDAVGVGLQNRQEKSAISVPKFVAEGYRSGRLFYRIRRNAAHEHADPPHTGQTVPLEPVLDRLRSSIARMQADDKLKTPTPPEA